jgi:hypothetical protein
MAPKTIEFVQDWFAEVESIPGRMKQVAFRRGETVLAQVGPHREIKGEPTTADLRLADGTTARHVPVSHFTVAQELARAA